MYAPELIATHIISNNHQLSDPLLSPVGDYLFLYTFSVPIPFLSQARSTRPDKSGDMISSQDNVFGYMESGILMLTQIQHRIDMFRSNEMKIKKTDAIFSDV